MAFSDQTIEPEKIKSLFEAMRWAPSSFNEQPWRVVYATKEMPEAYDRLASLLNESNVWARSAYMLLVFCAVSTFKRNGKSNRHHQYDTGAAAEHLFLQTSALGLIGHEMAGFDHERAHEVLHIPADVAVMAMMAAGYPGDETKLSPENLERQHESRQRNPIDDFAFVGEWQAK